MARIAAFFAWFNAEPGRKRIVAGLILAVAQVLHGLDAALGSACGVQALHGWVCQIDPDSWIVYLSMLNQFIQQYIVPGADAAGILLGAWGVAHAASRAKDDGHSNVTAAIAAISASVAPPMPPATATVIPQEPKV